MLNENVPEQVGVPEKNRLEVSVNPGDRLPLMTMNEYAEVPPLALMVVL